MYDYITPQRLPHALTFLKANNADIDEWLESAMVNDANFCECLVEQQNDRDEQPIVTCVDSPVIPSPNIAMDCSDIADPLITAMHLGKTKWFTIQSIKNTSLKC